MQNNLTSKLNTLSTYNFLKYDIIFYNFTFFNKGERGSPLLSFSIHHQHLMNSLTL